MDYKREINSEDETADLIKRHRTANSTNQPQNRPSTDTIFHNRITFTVTETAVFMGISVKSVERAIKRGDIYAKKLGRRLLIPRGSIEAWLNRKD